MNLEIKKTEKGWIYIIDSEEHDHYVSEYFDSAKNAFEVGSKKLLEFLPKEQTFDFGAVQYQCTNIKMEEVGSLTLLL